MTDLTKVKLTANQAEALHVLSQYAGRTVSCLTSGYIANVAPEAVRASVGIFNAAALRGLAAKGFIELDAYWKGATIKVLTDFDPFA